MWDQKDVVYYSGPGEEGEPLTTLSPAQLNNLFALAKVTFTLELWSRDSSRESLRDLSPAPGHHGKKGNATVVCEELDSAAACFRLRSGRLVLHNGSGEGGNGGVLCGGGGGAVVGGDEAAGSVLFKAAGGKKKGGGGSGGSGGSTQQEATFQLLFNRSVAAADTTSAAAPVVRVDNRETHVLSAIVSGEAVVYLDKGAALKELPSVLANGVAQQVRLAEYWLAKQRVEAGMRGPLSALATLPHAAGHLLSLVYPEAVDEDKLKEYREAVHRTFLLPLDRPMVRRGNGLTPPPGIRPSALANPHATLSPPGLGVASVVSGGYMYYHYLQGKTDDKGWGCAYRSLQTIVSWYQLQGYTTRPIPSHKEIQKCLVDIGDKPADFIGSKKWIGSTEVGFVLETLYKIRSRFICVSSGAELASRGGELAMHFETQGTPVMIGGGVLAHTILGVDYNQDTQQTAFLVLDPHYTGSDDLTSALAKGGVAWKNSDFWNANAFYNLCLPQRPVCI